MDSPVAEFRTERKEKEKLFGMRFWGFQMKKRMLKENKNIVKFNHIIY